MALTEIPIEIGALLREPAIEDCRPRSARAAEPSENVLTPPFDNVPELRWLTKASRARYLAVACAGDSSQRSALGSNALAAPLPGIIQCQAQTEK
jgi:hypothetical protein